MKIIRYSLATALLTIVHMAHAQVVTLKDIDGNVVNGQTVTVVASTWQFQMESDLIVTLNGTASKDINVRRYELNTVAGTQNYFCWGVCYLPVGSGINPVWASLPQDTVNMSPGVDFAGFHAYYMPAGVSASAGFRFVWFDIDNPMDTTWADIHFDTEHVGVEEAGATATLNAFPNPMRGGELMLDHSPVSNGELVLLDVIGNTVMRRSLNGGTRSYFDLGSLADGVYFATLRSNGETIATRRIVVNGR